MQHETIIRGATVIDGTGNQGFQADIALDQGKISAIGKISASAKRTIDAHGLIASPGFIDNHTHYDAQVCWDPLLTPSAWHGVTTAIVGNCGLGIAPVKLAGRDIAIEDLVTIEGMPQPALTAGIDWDWESYPEYLASMQRRKPGINLGFLAGLTPFRHYVLGEEAIERASTPQEIAKIQALLREAIQAGALGFSTSRLPVDIGYKGKPVASRLAPDDELEAYANVLRDMNKGVIQLSLLSEVGKMLDSEYELVDKLLTASGRPVTWLALLSRADRPDAGSSILRRCADQARRGARPAVAVRPMILTVSLKGNPLVMGELSAMQKAFNKNPHAQITVYKDPAFRAELKSNMTKPGLIVWDWKRITVNSVQKTTLKMLENHSIAELAMARQQEPADVFLDIAIEDNLETTYSMPLFNTDDALCAELFNAPDTLVSLSDGGAHADMLSDAGYTTYMLGYWVREKQAISLESAVRKLSADQADFYGIRDRGRLQPGLAADIVLFDPACVGSPLKPEIVHDFPAGCKRMITRPTGIEYVFVNGQTIMDHAQQTDARPGVMVRN
jgi:N-acyl-D-aspartate/D-glutamate deacylase